MWQANSGMLDVIGLAVKGPRKKLIIVVVVNKEFVAGEDCFEMNGLIASRLAKFNVKE
jgi:hypothetical protein